MAHLHSLSVLRKSLSFAAGSLLLLGVLPVLAYGQGVTFAGVQGTVAQNAVLGAELCPYSVAIDRAGDVFIADYCNNRVLEVPVGGGAPIAVGSGLNSPYGVAVDGTGNVFIADTFNNRVVKVPAGETRQVSGASALLDPVKIICVLSLLHLILFIWRKSRNVLIFFCNFRNLLLISARSSM